MNSKEKSSDAGKDFKDEKTPEYEQVARTSTGISVKKQSIWRHMLFQKTLNSYDIGSGSSKLWNIFELIAIGIGGTLGFGVYILIGHIAHEQTGPSALVSFLIAGIAGFLGGRSKIEIL